MSYPAWPDWTEDQWRASRASATKFDEAKHPRKPGGTEHGGEFASTLPDVPVFEGVDFKANAEAQIEKHLGLWKATMGKHPTPEALKETEDELRAMPLVHGTTIYGAVAAATEGLASHADMQPKIKELLAESDELRKEIQQSMDAEGVGDADWSHWNIDNIRSALDLNSSDEEELAAKIQELVSIEQVIQGMTSPPDEALGLDQFVFMTHGEKHQDYGNVAVIIDNDVIQHGWATQQDIATIPNIDQGGAHYSEKGIQKYQSLIVKGDDYYKVAAAAAGSVTFLKNRSRDQLFEVKAPKVSKSAVKGFMVENDLDTAQRLADQLAQKGLRNKVLYIGEIYGEETRTFIHEQLKFLQSSGFWDREAIKAFNDEHDGLGVYLL